MRALRADAAGFQRARDWAVAGLTAGCLLWLVAFLSVGGEWFLMWQSKTWNGQEAAFRMFTVVGIILILFALPWLDRSSVRSARFRSLFRPFFWLLVADCVLLTFAGRQPPEGTWLTLSRVGAAYYFFHFLFILPFVAWIERPAPLPASIAQLAVSAQHVSARVQSPRNSQRRSA